MIIVRLNELLRTNASYKYRCNRYSTELLADFPATFTFKDVERQCQNVWEKNKCFAVKSGEKEALKMLLPPPNITGTLHIGHALTVTIQDILARWYRMRGHPVIWIPGFDHAGISTQVTIEKYLYKTKSLTKSEVGREQFLSLVWDWKKQKENVIKLQLQALGASLDWSREYFTMSKEHSKAVTEAFLRLNDRNLLYRKKALINWCPALRSTISDIEVEHLYINERTELEVPGYKKKVKFGEMAYVAYPVKDSKDEIIVATTRPETVFGDVAIAVHPDDQRYAKYIGQKVWHVLRETYIPVVPDPSVDMNFGTGALKVTPAHDHLDYTIATNHQLDVIDVVDEYGNITDAGERFKGLPRFLAREKVLNELAHRGMLRKVCGCKMSVPICSRSRDVVEYLLKEQWFVKCKGMAEKAMQAVKENRLKIVPSTHEQVWYDSLSNIRDWCISRQLWWGHSIPAYNVTIGDKIEWITARSENDARLIAQNKYGSDVELHPDQDLLDTWFSSAILPFAALGWPNETEDLKKYYPLTLMETGHDILFHWVAKMVMLGLELTDRLPFDEVVLHGILCDAYGKKMSKTLGNVVLPENIINGITLKDLAEQMKKSYDTGVLSKAEMRRMLSGNNKMFPNGIPECGADALRMTLSSHNIKNQKINFDIMKCQTNAFFCNKIWQASKYVILATGDKLYQRPETLTLIDRWILSRLSALVDIVNHGFAQRDFHKSAQSIKQFLHYEYCDFYLEATKWGLRSEDSDVVASHTYGLRKCLEVSLRVLAPVMPYLAEDLYGRLSTKFPEFSSAPSLMEASYPTPEQFSEWRDITLDEKTDEVLDIVFEIRSLLANVSKKLNPTVHIVTRDSDDFQFYNEVTSLIRGGSRISNIYTFLENDYTESGSSICYPVTADCTLFITVEDSSSLEQLKKNLNKKVTRVEGNLKI